MNTKKWFLSKTNWLNFIALALTVLTFPQLGDIVPATWLPSIGVITAFGNWILRNYSSQPIPPTSL